VIAGEEESVAFSEEAGERRDRPAAADRGGGEPTELEPVSRGEIPLRGVRYGQACQRGMGRQDLHGADRVLEDPGQCAAVVGVRAGDDDPAHVAERGACVGEAVRKSSERLRVAGAAPVQGDPEGGVLECPHVDGRGGPLIQVRQRDPPDPERLEVELGHGSLRPSMPVDAATFVDLNRSSRGLFMRVPSRRGSASPMLDTRDRVPIN
jgi:hypothetical protein